MKRLIFFTIFTLLFFKDTAYCENMNIPIINEQMNYLSLQELEKTIEDISKEYEVLPNISVKTIVLDLIKGKSPLNFRDILNSIGQIFFKELRSSMGLLGKILVIVLISSLLTNIQSSFENASVAELANYIAYILIAILLISSFKQIMDLTTSTIDKMVNFMQIILPLLLTLLTAVSGVNTRILFHPMILMTVNLIGILIKFIILPLIFFSFIISIISNLSTRIEFSKLSELGRQVIAFTISAALTIFIGIITIYGIGSKIDGLTIRTAKFAVDNFIPIVGGFLSDAVEAVVGCSAILKNGIGFIGLLTLLFICILPILRILVLLLVYKLVAVAIQPIGSSNLVELFNQVSKSLLLLLISLISAATMFFITITIVVEAGNNLLMLR
ncbi:MAG: stage III sporulation protein AE [Tissierellaceae bacterium]|nr:stage III sporulation protein AE [Tissierellaceae bacterium]